MKKKTGLNRNNNEKYYTKPCVVYHCIQSIKSIIKINFENDIIIEPSAGNGSFIKTIKELCKNYKFYDLYPENIEIIKQDYLNLKTDIFEKYNKIHMIGNPPFGRQSSLAIKFIKKSCMFCDTISFILPKSFMKESRKRTFSLYFHLVFEKVLPIESFIINNKSYNVPCVFQIWKKKNYKREKIKKLKPVNYKFVKKNETPDISFRRVGVYAGKVDKEIENKSPQSHYFIKFNNVFTEDLFKKIKFISYKSSEYTVGPKSISKQELIKELNKFTQ